eukprot:CAMPEP_0171524536 /NCGR_PEP_ID=MMETSP0959-20130129/9123_1 /TAXON_ID=87120 /ORGANISM="Aurantiochytrium limacinum, Strain ATCCMYA-1381" /LENGTH=89 /DNA_ID=CAMNT_0012065321 /DNA_START=1364 /DNA_END=1634 /DNA_ORIENTATION=-
MPDSNGTRVSAALAQTDLEHGTTRGHMASSSQRRLARAGTGGGQLAQLRPARPMQELAGAWQDRSYATAESRGLVCAARRGGPSSVEDL